MAENLAAGLLMCRLSNGVLEYFLVHPGGPYYKNKDPGVWSIPKGIPEGTEELIHTAQREFFEETGIKPEPPFYDIGFIRQKAGKMVHAWTFCGAWNPENGISCNHFLLEWPPDSGRNVEFPEVDKARWMIYAEAITHIIPEQIPLLDRAQKIYSDSGKFVL
jgi:predicted NUDIX family NTP pyrophosphohydrolase